MLSSHLYLRNTYAHILENAMATPKHGKGTSSYYLKSIHNIHTYLYNFTYRII